MHIEPITCLRPQPKYAQEFCAEPYDVFTDEEARAYVEAHPRSFLAIDRPETAFPPGQDPSAPEVYAKAQEILRDRQRDNTLTIDETPALYLYELTLDGHSQLGVMCAVACDDYLTGVVHRHELTLPVKELDRVNHIKTTRAQTGPVFIAYRDNMAIDVITKAATMAEPLYDFVAEDGVRQRVWRVTRPSAVESLQLAFQQIADAYIADGHHRAAAACRICQERREQGKENDPAESFLAVLFPQSQLKILPYDRIVANDGNMTAEEIAEALKAENFEVSGPKDNPADESAKGSFEMYFDGSWYTLTWTGDADDLDVGILQDHVLAPIFHIEDPRRDERVSFLGGVTPQELREATPEGHIAFALHPTSMDELFAVSDAGGLMPPKSTWFSPKLLSGIALRRIW